MNSPVTAARRLYIAGPMRGYPEHNHPAFYAAEARFLADGWLVRNPATIGWSLFGNNPDVPASEYLRADVRALATCDAIALLSGWECSTGARCEVVVAVTLGLTFYDAETGEQIPAPARVTCTGGYEQAPGRVDTLDGLAAEIRAWQAATFPLRTPHSVAKHLEKEAGELANNPTDRREIADCFMLTVGAADTNRFDLVAAVREKFEEVKSRTWGEPDADGVVEHVREADRTEPAVVTP